MINWLNNYYEVIGRKVIESSLWLNHKNRSNTQNLKDKNTQKTMNIW